MAVMAGRRAAARVGLALIVGLMSVGSKATQVLAASPSVGAPTTTVVFLTGITFKGSATLNSDVARVEIVIDVEGSTRSIVAEVPSGVKSGTANLTWTLETPTGSLYPNTDVVARFRLAMSDGSTVLGPPASVHYEDTRFAWKTITGEFVKVHWIDGGQAFGRKAMRIGDDAVREVSALLGVTEREPIDFYVYSDRTAFYDVLGPAARENVGGTALPDIRTLFANIGPDAVDDPWVGIVIPHELTHLVLDSAVRNAYHYPPRWLNEGIAVYLSESYGSSDRKAVASAVAAGSVMPLRALGARFPTTQERFRLAYAESVAAVSFLVDTYGRDAMVNLVRSYARGVSDDEAFTAALGVDVAGFESAWLGSIGARTPSPLGPQPAPAGPMPAGWSGPAPTPGTVAGSSPSPSPSPESSGPVDQESVATSGTSLVASIGVAVAIIAGFALWAWRRSKRRNATLAAVSASDHMPETYPALLTEPPQDAESMVDADLTEAGPLSDEEVAG